MEMKKLIISLALAFPLIANAESLNLLQAYEKAKQYDATLRGEVANNNAQKEEMNKAFAAFLPQARVSVYEGRNVTDSQTPGAFKTTSKQHSVYDSSNYNFSVRQSIFNKANFADYSRSKAVVAGSEAMLESAVLNLTNRVTGSYLDLLLAADNVIYSEAQKTSAQSQLENAKRLYKGGFGTITEISEANANLENVIAQALEADNNLEFAKRALENVTGIYVDTYMSLDPSKLSLSAPIPVTIDEWIAIALEKNPDIVVAQNSYFAMSQDVEKSTSGHYPTLDLIASRSHTQSDNNYTIGSKYDTDSIGFQLNVPIYSGGYVSATVNQAVAKQEEAREKLSEKQRAVTADVRKFFNEIVNGIARIEAKSQAVKFNETALIGTQKGYEAGTRSNVEVLNAQEKLFAAKRDLAKERYKLIFNRIQLKQVAGVLTEADVVEVNNSLAYQGLENEK